MKLKTIALIGFLLAVGATILEVCTYPSIFGLPMSPLAQGNWFAWFAGLFVANIVIELCAFLLLGSLAYAVAYLVHKRLGK